MVLKCFWSSGWHPAWPSSEPRSAISVASCRCASISPVSSEIASAVAGSGTDVKIMLTYRISLSTTKCTLHNVTYNFTLQDIAGILQSYLDFGIPAPKGHSIFKGLARVLVIQSRAFVNSRASLNMPSFLERLEHHRLGCGNSSNNHTCRDYLTFVFISFSRFWLAHSLLWHCQGSKTLGI